MLFSAVIILLYSVLRRPGMPYGYRLEDMASDSQTEREERNHLDGSIAERVPGSQGNIPRPLGRQRRRSLLGPGLALGYDTFHYAVMVREVFGEPVDVLGISSGGSIALHFAAELAKQG
jgi:hypothetical protein